MVIPVILIATERVVVLWLNQQVRVQIGSVFVVRDLHGGEEVAGQGLEVESDDRVRFIQSEEFRGSLAESMAEDTKQFTQDAFRAMNEALATRIQTHR